MIDYNAEEYFFGYPYTAMPASMVVLLKVMDGFVAGFINHEAVMDHLEEIPETEILGQSFTRYQVNVVSDMNAEDGSGERVGPLHYTMSQAEEWVSRNLNMDGAYQVECIYFEEDFDRER